MTGLFSLGGDLPVDRLGFGAMRLPRNDRNVPARDPETGRTVLRRAIELGVNHIDTADFYRSADGSVRANALIREALSPYPPGLVIGTKVGPVFGSAARGRAQPPTCGPRSKPTSKPSA
ncbi:MAG TPA: aldo/keto reductase [Streptosporangiaceae bacterium]|nr:aldo/keto reductase [Streptosporangiaceae bacterium]